MNAHRLPALLLLVAVRATAQAPPLRIETTTLAPGIHVISGYTNGNILAVVGDTGVVLVDAQTSKRVAQADSALRTYTTRPVTTVINTHYHEDHTSGNAYFRTRGAAVIAHRNVAVQAAKDTTIDEWQHWHRTPAAPASMPTRTFDDSLVLRLGDEEIHVLHAPRAHTDGDAIVWLLHANVVHVGDIVEVGAPPFIDWWVGGGVDGMVEAVDMVLARMNATTRVVPGHGAVIGRDALRAYRDMLATVGARVRDAVNAGRSPDAIVVMQPAGEYVSSLGSASRADGFVRLLAVGYARSRPR